MPRQPSAGSRRCVVIALLAFLASSTLAQNARIDGVLQQLQQVHTVSNVTISPDGRWVSWTEEILHAGDTTTVAYIQDRLDSTAQPLLLRPPGADTGRVNDVAWSPDSRHVAFLSADGASQDQVFVASVPDQDTQRVTNLDGQKLTSLDGFVTGLRWSPDGKQLGFLYAEHGGGGGPLQAAPAQLGEIGEAFHNQRLTMIAASGGELHQITPADLNIYEYDWAPDGEHFVATAAPGPADDNWWTAKLYSVSKSDGKMTQLYVPPAQLQLAVPRWSPDGKHIAFIGGLMSDEGFTGGDIFAVPAAGGVPRNLTAGRKFSASSLRWKDGDHILFTAAVLGGGQIASLDLRSGESELLWKGEQNFHEDGHNPNFAIAANGKTSVVVRSSWQEAPEVWTGPLGGWQQLTRVNAQQKAQWGKAENILWQSGGYTVQGWLVFPENYDPSKRYPMVVEIHGGPAGVRSASWPTTHFDMSVMAGLGYFVFFPNPRGSYGNGEGFTRANVKDFGGGDLRDVLAGVDAVLKKTPVDRNRIGVTGWSYGGYMTMWTVTQTSRFRAAVAGAGIANWESYYGENLIDKWMIPYFGASVYDNPAVYAKSSPITYIKHVTTPTLVIVGEHDAECPAPQSFEFWHALKTLQVPTKLVVYGGEGHSFRDPKDQLDVMRRSLAWFDKYLGTAE